MIERKIEDFSRLRISKKTVVLIIVNLLTMCLSSMVSGANYGGNLSENGNKIMSRAWGPLFG